MASEQQDMDNNEADDDQMVQRNTDAVLEHPMDPTKLKLYNQMVQRNISVEFQAPITTIKLTYTCKLFSQIV